VITDVGAGTVIAPNPFGSGVWSWGYRPSHVLGAKTIIEPIGITMFEEGFSFPFKKDLEVLTRELRATVEQLYPDNHAEVLERVATDGEKSRRESRGNREIATFFEHLRGPERLLISAMR
jgi:hypothetical protein